VRVLFSIRMRAEKAGAHISGAEGIYEEKDLLKVTKEFGLRALNHSKGKPDLIRLKVEPLREKPLLISSLPVFTIKTNGPKDALKKGISLLKVIGVSEKTIDSALKVVFSGRLRGAALISIKGKRLDRVEGGVRARMIGITKRAEKRLSFLLEEKGLSHYRVQEAIVLASKVACAPGVLAELCVSDEPDYTTGYVASTEFGYLRLPRIKKKGARIGGRVFFIKENSPLRELLFYLRETPVMIGKVSPVGGIITFDDLGFRKAYGRNRSEPGGAKGLRKKNRACARPPL
jgi:6-carboxyhexanoate--CoA ligase